MGIEVLVPDVNLSASDFTAAAAAAGCNGQGVDPLRAVRHPQRRRGPGRAHRRRAGARRALRRLLRLLPPGRPGRAQQADRRVADQGAAPSTRSATPARACAWCSSRSSTAPSPGAGSADQGVMSLFESLDGPDAGGFDDARVADPRHRVRQVAAPGVREGDARPLRQRPPPARASRRRWPATPTDASPSCWRLEGAGEGGRGTRWVGGVVTGLARKYTKKGDLMATFILEDLQSAIEVWVFPRTMIDVGLPPRRRRRGLRQGPPRHQGGPAEADLHGAQAARAERSTGAEPLHLDVPAPRPHRRAGRRSSSGSWSTIPGTSPVFLHVGHQGASAWRRVQRRTRPTACWRSCGSCSGRRCLWNREPAAVA